MLRCQSFRIRLREDGEIEEVEVEGGLKLVAVGKKRKGSQVTGEQRTERSIKRGEKKGGVGESTWRGEPYKERERNASSSSCAKSHARRNEAMGAKVATKMGFACPNLDALIAQ